MLSALVSLSWATKNILCLGGSGLFGDYVFKDELARILFFYPTVGHITRIYFAHSPILKPVNLYHPSVFLTKKKKCAFFFDKSLPFRAKGQF